MKTYKVKVKHDAGVKTIKTTALNEESAKQKIVLAENCPIQAIKKIERIYPKLKKGDLIQVIAKEWFDKTYGNSYFSAIVYLNNDPLIYIPFQYGYGTHYQEIASKEMKKAKMIPDLNGWQLREFLEKKKVNFLHTKHENCLKRDVISFGIED